MKTNFGGKMIGLSVIVVFLGIIVLAYPAQAQEPTVQIAPIPIPSVSATKPALPQPSPAQTTQIPFPLQDPVTNNGGITNVKPSIVADDTNGDGIADSIAVGNVNGDTLSEVIILDPNGDGKPDTMTFDTNNDWKPEIIVIDSNGDGKPDVFQFDTDSDGTIDWTWDGEDTGDPLNPPHPTQVRPPSGSNNYPPQPDVRSHAFFSVDITHFYVDDGGSGAVIMDIYNSDGDPDMQSGIMIYFDPGRGGVVRIDIMDSNDDGKPDKIIWRFDMNHDDVWDWLAEDTDGDGKPDVWTQVQEKD